MPPLVRVEDKVLLLVQDVPLRGALAEALAPSGWGIERLEGLSGLAAIVEAPRAVVLQCPPGTQCADAVQAVRQCAPCSNATLVCLDVPACNVGEVLSAGADDVFAQGEERSELPRRVANAVRTWRDDRRAHLDRAALHALLEITEAATSELDLDALLRAVVQRVARTIPVDRCSAVLLDPATRQAVVVTSHDVPELHRLPIDLQRYPEVRRALELRTTVVVDDVQRDPLLEEVRPLIRDLPLSSLLVVPLTAVGDTYGALLLRCARAWAFDADEQAFLRAAASAIANSVRNAQLFAAVREKRDVLERAYAERYRDLERLNEQLAAANRDKEALLEICSHDMRSPLQVVLFQARLLALDAPRPAQARRIESIERQAEHVRELVERILERGRGRAGPWELRKRPVAIAELLAGLLADLADVARARGVTLRAEARDDLRVDADPGALRQVLENLIGNAVAHAAPGTCVEMEVRRDEASGLARFEVRDRGEGIGEGDLALIFERYRRGSSSAGMGLGLAICRDIVAAHGGAIWAARREGGGTAMAFTLPYD